MKQSVDIPTQQDIRGHYTNYAHPVIGIVRAQAWGHPSSKRKALALHGYLDNTGSFDLMGPALAKASRV